MCAHIAAGWHIRSRLLLLLLLLGTWPGACRGGRTVCRVFVGYFVGPYIGTISGVCRYFVGPYVGIASGLCRYCVGTMSDRMSGITGCMSGITDCMSDMVSLELGLGRGRLTKLP